MKRVSIAALVVAAFLAVAVSSPAQTATPPPLNLEQRVQVMVNRNKSTRIQGGDWDDKLDRISFSVKLTNSDTRVSFDGLKGEFYVLAQSILNPKAYQVLGAERFTFSLPPRGSHSLSTTEVTTRWDRTVAKHGAKYDAWVLVIRDSTDKVVMRKSSSPSWVPVADKMASVSVNGFYDREMRPTIGR